MDILRIGARDRLDQGELSVYFTAGNTGSWGVVALALRSLVGRVRQARNFNSFSARTLRVQTRKTAIDVSTDGEVHHLSSPLVYRMHPAALRVITAGKSDGLHPTEASRETREPVGSSVA